MKQFGCLCIIWKSGCGSARTASVFDTLAIRRYTIKEERNVI